MDIAIVMGFVVLTTAIIVFAMTRPSPAHQTKGSGQESSED
ncbi:hypothetical protein [Roseobacter sp. HKCCA0434]|nr:hypothetical protein [Roseobacter sp. HKCCA0434]